MYSRVCILHLLYTIVAIILEGLNPIEEPHGGRGYGVPWKEGHHLLDLRHQQGGSVERTGRQWTERRTMRRTCKRKGRRKPNVKKRTEKYL
jgi:hypothetical protein